MKFSRRISNVHESPIRKLVPMADNSEKNGKKVYYLNIGQPDIETPTEFFDAVKSFDKKVLEYTSSQGIPELLESFSEYYKKINLDYCPEDIIVTNGGSEALLFSLMAICDPGDNVLIPEPFYANYSSFTSSIDVEVNPIFTSVDNGFHLPKKEEIVKLINSKTKALVISNPGNPTGTVYTPIEVKMLGEIALENDLFIISDEVYREFIYNGTEFLSFGHLKNIEDRVILADSISKRFSSCGARIGCVVSKNSEFLFQILKLSQSRLCVSTINQIGAAALSNVSSSYLLNSQKEYKARRDLVYNALIEMEGVKCVKPEGAFYITTKLPVENAEDFAVWLLNEYSLDNETVFVAPAEGFYVTKNLGIDEVRISYVLNLKDLEKAMNIIKHGLIEYNKRNNI